MIPDTVPINSVSIPSVDTAGVVKLPLDILPLADKLPVTLKPDNSNPISKLVADNRFVASMVSAIIVLLLLIKFVVVLPLLVTSCKLIKYQH